FPDVPVVTEESLCKSDLSGGCFFLVDPLDGTRDFLAGRPEFTVNIALVKDERPTAGAIYAPLLNRLWIGGETARAADVGPQDALVPVAWQVITTRPAPPDGLVALASLSHGDAATERFLARLSIKQRRNVSSSIKFCMLAQGEADVYPRFGPTMEWDVAAGEAI